MAPTSTAHTDWHGDLASGKGRTTPASGAFATVDVNWTARSEGSDTVTTPEELLAAAHASCFAMALSHALGEAGTPPTRLSVDVEVTFAPGVGITTSVISVAGEVPGIDQAGFQNYAAEAKDGCPVSKALTGVAIALKEARLENAG